MPDYIYNIFIVITIIIFYNSVSWMYIQMPNSEHFTVTYLHSSNSRARPCVLGVLAPPAFSPQLGGASTQDYDSGVQLSARVHVHPRNAN